MRLPHRSPVQTTLKAPPLWYVSNGGSVIGPMTTATLLRGVAFGRVPENSLVRGHVWDHWRHVFQIREVCALRRVQNRTRAYEVPATPDEEGRNLAQRLFGCAQSPGEALLLTLHAAVEATRAEVGLAHRYCGPHRAFVTSFTLGGDLEPLGGKALPGYDAVCAAAIEGRGVWGSHGVGTAQRTLVQRLGQGRALRGVAMVPIRALGYTYAMVEVGRADHPFRACDKARLAGVRKALEELFEVQRWDPWSRT